MRSCWGKARVKDIACVRGNAVVRGEAIIRDNAQVLNDACVKGRAIVSNSACVMQKAVIDDNAIITENAVIGGCAYVGGFATVRYCTVVIDDAYIVLDTDFFSIAPVGSMCRNFTFFKTRSGEVKILSGDVYTFDQFKEEYPDDFLHDNKIFHKLLEYATFVFSQH